LKRKLFIAWILIAKVFLCSAQTPTTNTSNLQFIENKGQWDSRVKYNADTYNGHFLVTSHGFAVLMHNMDDIDRVQERMHGHRSSLKANAGTAGSAKLSAKNPIVKATAAPDTNSLMIRSHLYEVSFVNANANAELIADKPLPTYNNYFIGNDHSKWASHCQIYQGITYKNVYPNIDVRYYTDQGNLKYDIILHPGANPDLIAMKYQGTSGVSLKGNQLITHTSVGDVKGLEPHAYQQNASGRRDLESHYELGKDSVVHFKIKDYSPDATVIIDPTLVFCTFTGSRADNWGYTATYDGDGNFYSGSIILNDWNNGNGFPLRGAYQTVFSGGDQTDGGFEYDVGIMKFNSNGSNLFYSTYLGGSGNEQPHSLIVDASNDLVIAGRTSSADFPTLCASCVNGTVGTGGGYDIFITKLTAKGDNLIGSMKIGGAKDDGVNIAPKYSTSPVPMGQFSIRLNYGDDGRSEVALDPSGNICLSSCTQSTNFPLVNAFQGAFGGGMQDGVFIKTDPGVQTVLASSYLGGNLNDACFVVDVSPTTGEIYVGGATESTNLPGSHNLPVLHPTNQGGIDGFVSVLDPTGTKLIETSYFGTNTTDAIYGIKFDAKGFPYIMGTTYSSNWPVVNAPWKQAGGKQFIAKLQPDLSGYVYSTVFGKGAPYPDLSPTAFLVDRCENVYVAGWGGGLETEGCGVGQTECAVYNNSNTSGLTITAGALKNHTDNMDFYFFVLQRNAASQLYGTWFGQDGELGDHVDGGTSRFDKQGTIYEGICANCYSAKLNPTNVPTTPGTWSPQNGTGGQACNFMAVKIAFNFAGVGADLHSYINGVPDSAGCIPLNVYLSDTIRNAKLYIWDFGDGSRDTTTSYALTHLYSAVGTYPVMLIAIDSNSCNVSDTVYVHIRAKNNPATVKFNAIKQLPCQSLSYQYNNLSSPPLGQNFTATSFVWNFGDGSPNDTAGLGPQNHSYQSSGTYIVTLTLIDTNFCNAPELLTDTLNVAPLVKAQFITPDSGCVVYNAVFENTSQAGQQFFWTFGDGTMATTTAIGPLTHTYPTVGNYVVTLIAVDSNTCNIADTMSETIHVFPKPVAAFTVGPVPPLSNTPNVFTNLSTGATHYIWRFGDGDSTMTANLDTVMHQYEKTFTFTACLIAINQFGCDSMVCQPVQTLVHPLLDVPNAFTPGRFGQNSIIKVASFGISSMDWRIYNRWGQLVFESNDPTIGWDGNFRGNAQPMDVYGYTLSATFFDGTKTTRTGDITLIR
jgi:gliding motility-associated-like protein